MIPKLREVAQLAAYRLGTKFPNAKCANVYFSRESGEMLLFNEWSEQELKYGWEYFSYAYRIAELNNSWKTIQKA